MNWHIGQDIVCIKSNSDVLELKKGKIYGIIGLRYAPCGCGVQINIGMSIPLYFKGYIYCCEHCGSKIPDNDGMVWWEEYYFAPLADISELEEILKQKEEA